MPHFPKPFFRKDRQLWYVQIGGHQHNLGTDRKKAFEQYHDLMRQPVVRPAERRTTASTTAVALIDRYLDWCHEHRAAATYEWYRWRLQRFAKAIGANLTTAELHHFHLDDWFKKHPGWSNGTKHGMARAVQRVLHWAKRKGYIDANPLADYEKARPGKRRVVIVPATFDRMLALAGSNEFRDLLTFTWQTAARPQESLIAEARHVDLANARLVLPADEAKGEQWPRIVYLTDSAMAIVRRLMLKFPTGPLFRNSAGRPWSTYAVNCAFSRLQVRMGKAGMKEEGVKVAIDPKLSKREKRRAAIRSAKQHARKYSLYHLRHSWLDQALKRGVDALTCAILMGHRDPSTISKVYQHLSQSPEYLRGRLKS
jgi:integrase